MKDKIYESAKSIYNLCYESETAEQFIKDVHIELTKNLLPKEHELDEDFREKAEALYGEILMVKIASLTSRDTLIERGIGAILDFFEKIGIIESKEMKLIKEELPKFLEKTKAAETTASQAKDPEIIPEPKSEIIAEQVKTKDKITKEIYPESLLEELKGVKEILEEQIKQIDDKDKEKKFQIQCTSNFIDVLVDDLTPENQSKFSDDIANEIINVKKGLEALEMDTGFLNEAEQISMKHQKNNPRAL